MQEVIDAFRALPRIEQLRRIEEMSPADAQLLLGVMRRQETLRDFIPRVSPTIEGATTQAPVHLKPLLDAFARVSRGEVVKILVTLPPGSGKTETTLHSLAWLMGQRTRPVIYGSYNQEMANEKSLRARDIAVAAGLKLRADAFNVKRWHLENGSTFRAVGVGGGTGGRADLLVIDDPIKGADEARSPTMKARVWSWLWAVLRTRAREWTSTVIIHTRWAEDDPIGRIQQMQEKLPEDERGWETFHLPALDDNDESMIPWYSSKFFRELRAELKAAGQESVWWSLYQGAPRPPEGTTFRGCRTYAELPSEQLEWGAGIDLAYSDSSTADFNAIAVMARHVASDIYYVVHIEHWRGTSETHQPGIDRVRALFPQAFRKKALFRGSGPEKGAEGHLKYMQWKAATADKAARAQPMSAAWNIHEGEDGTEVGGRVLVPEDDDGTSMSTWDVDGFVRELQSFPGPNDDRMDAAASAFERVSKRRSVTPQLGSIRSTNEWGDM